MKKTVVLGMSGGVDSSVSAYLLKEQGYDVIGVTMALYDGPGCSTAQNIKDAEAVAKELGIPFQVLSLEPEFEREVIDYFVEEYKAGRTPNPCVVCNRKIKFGRFLEEALKIGADYIATGHYAKIVKDEERGRFLLMEGKDKAKDQTYFLYRLTQDQLSRVLMPLADYRKDEVRALALEKNLPVAEKKDSEDVCFIPDGEPMGFLAGRGESSAEGNFVDLQGNVLGRHRGIMYYTVGQRRGLGLAMGKRVFVAAIRPETNEIVIGEDEDLYRRKVLITDVNFIPFDTLEGPLPCEGKIRYSRGTAPCTVAPYQGEVLVTFEEPVRAPTKGQSCVLYQGELVIGGGTIKDSW